MLRGLQTTRLILGSLVVLLLWYVLTNYSSTSSYVSVDGAREPTPLATHLRIATSPPRLCDIAFHTPPPGASIKKDTERIKHKCANDPLDVILSSWSSYEGRYIVLTHSNQAYLPLMANLVCSMKAVNLTNHIGVAWDDEAASWYTENGIPCVRPSTVPLPNFANYGAPQFVRMVSQKVNLMLNAMGRGFDILYVDADIVFERNPIDDLRAKATEYSLLFLEDIKRPSTSFFFTVANWETAQIVRKLVKRYDERGIFEIDQFVWQDNLPRHSPFEQLQWALLPSNEYSDGRYFWNLIPSKRVAINPFIIHGNWISGLQSKTTRLKENGYWYYHPDSIRYPGERLFSYRQLLRDNLAGQAYQFNALRNAIAVSYLLKRTLVLPLFQCYSSESVRYPSEIWCTLDQLLDIDRFQASLKSIGVTFREHSYLYLPTVPHNIKHIKERVDPKPKQSVFGVAHTGRCGRTEEEWLELGIDYDSQTMIHFEELSRSFAGFKDIETIRRFKQVFADMELPEEIPNACAWWQV